MSQQKVDQYKKEKANRKKIMRHDKLVRRLEIGGTAVVFTALVVWFGAAVYSNAQANKEVEVATTELDTTALEDYLTELTTVVTVEEATEETADEAVEETTEETAEEIE